MNLTDEDYKSILECFDPKDIPKDPVQARKAIEAFFGLMKLLIQHRLPLPPGNSKDA